jgi:hypothetical protein
MAVNGGFLRYRSVKSAKALTPYARPVSALVRQLFRAIVTQRRASHAMVRQTRLWTGETDDFVHAKLRERILEVTVQAMP